MTEEPTCGQGLADYAVMPRLMARVLESVGDTLMAHVPGLVPDDAQAEAEQRAYERLAARHRDAAALLAEAGAAVVRNGRIDERVRDAVDRLRGELPDTAVIGVAADLTDAAAIDELTAAVAHVDILVNNAGTPEVKPFFDLTDDDWNDQIQLHLVAAVRLCRHYGQGMRDRGWGRILFNASTTGGFMSGEMAHYGATKAALLGPSRGLAENLTRAGVTVNCVVPGPTRERTEAAVGTLVKQPTGRSVADMEEEIFFGLKSSLIGRFIDPAEVADLVAFLATDHASAITGTTLRVDGGIVRSIV